MMSSVLCIAEIGSNHGGNLATAKEYITACARAGADAVKFQAMHPGQLTRQPMAFTPLRDEDYRPLFKLAHFLALRASATPFDLDSVGVLVDAGANYMKIASGDATYHDLIREVAATRLPCYLSTGMCTLEEVGRAVEVYTAVAGCGDLTLLHCVSLYPTRRYDLNLSALSTLQDAFGLPVGLSDHSSGSVAALGAVALGAVIIEKHVTLDRALPGPDHHFAMEMDEFKEMVCAIRKLEVAMGEGHKVPVQGELGRVKTVRRGYYVTRDLPMGTVLAPQDVIALRPQEDYVSPAISITGKVLLVDKREGDGITAFDVGLAAPKPLPIPFARPSIGKAEIRAVTTTLRSGWLTSGPRARALEEAVAEYTGAQHAVAVSSCTAGMHVTLAALGIGPGDEVIVPVMTFPAAANVVVALGAKPVFVDITFGPPNMHMGKVIVAISDRTKAIVPVHLYGHPCRMSMLLDVAEARGLYVVEDAAHALGAEYKGQRIGSLDSTATVFSFYATKNMTTGEGGMVTTADEDLADKIRLWSRHGITAGAWERGAVSDYDVVLPGFKYNMPDMQAALGLVQLERLPRFLEARRAIAEQYNKAFSQLRVFIIPATKDDVTNAWHIYNLQVLNGRDELVVALAEKGIQTSRHFRPLHRYTFYGGGAKRFRAAEAVYARSVSLPLYPAMRQDEVERVIAAVLDWGGGN